MQHSPTQPNIPTSWPEGYPIESSSCVWLICTCRDGVDHSLCRCRPAKSWK
jgi:hypothetical protein